MTVDHLDAYIYLRHVPSGRLWRTKKTRGAYICRLYSLFCHYFHRECHGTFRFEKPHGTIYCFEEDEESEAVCPMDLEDGYNAIRNPLYLAYGFTRNWVELFEKRVIRWKKQTPKEARNWQNATDLVFPFYLSGNRYDFVSERVIPFKPTFPPQWHGCRFLLRPDLFEHIILQFFEGHDPFTKLDRELCKAYVHLWCTLRQVSRGFRDFVTCTQRYVRPAICFHIHAGILWNDESPSLWRTFCVYQYEKTVERYRRRMKLKKRRLVQLSEDLEEDMERFNAEKEAHKKRMRAFQ